jgi:hypothetical protein
MTMEHGPTRDLTRYIMARGETRRDDTPETWGGFQMAAAMVNAPVSGQVTYDIILLYSISLKIAIHSDHRQL